MKSIVIYFSLLILYANLCGAQSDPPLGDFQFIGRYIEWPGGAYWSDNSTYLNDPVNHAVGFYDDVFTLPLHYDDRIAALGWHGEVNASVNAWNSVSGLAKLSLNPLGNTQTEFIVEWPPKNVIFVDEGNEIFPPDWNGLARTVTLKAWSDPGNCGSSTVPWTKGPILLQGDIALNNNDKTWFLGDGIAPSPFDYSVRSIVAHEIGHFFGINHYRRNVKRILMNKSHSSNKVKIPLQPEDIEMINRLYGNDGTLGGDNSDPFYSSIDCQDFVANVAHDVLATGPNGEPLVGGAISSECSNCIKDPYEDGIDCGAESGCGVLCEDICSYNTLELIKFDNYTPLYDYSIVKNKIQLLPSSSSIEIPDGNFKYLKAGQKIDIIPSPGYFFDTGRWSDVELVIGDCDCPGICSPYLPNVITPNCDGINDFLSFYVNGADFFSFSVSSRWGGTPIFNKIGTIAQNPIVQWGGTTNSGNMVSPGTYYYTLTLYSSCNDQERTFKSQVDVFAPDPCMLTHTPDQKMSVNDLFHQSDEHVFEDNITVYPNPFNRDIEITCTSNILSYRILASDGKEIDGRDLAAGQRNLRIVFGGQFNPGVYVLEVITNKGIHSERIVKNW